MLKIHFTHPLPPILPQQQIPLVLPFSKANPDRSDDPDYGRWDELIEYGANFFQPVHPVEAEVFVLPYKLESVYADPRLRAVVLPWALEYAADWQKPLWIFYNADDEKPSDFPDYVTLFRTSMRRSQRKPNERSWPGFSADFGQAPILSKPDLPTVSFSGFVSSVRRQAIDALKATPGIHFDCKEQPQFFGFMSPAERLAKREEMKKQMAESLYVLCARGGGNFSYRLTETLSMGRIPLLVDTDCTFPYITDYTWLDDCAMVPEEDLQNIGRYLKRFHDNHSDAEIQEIQKRLCLFWEARFSPFGFHRAVAMGELP